MFHSHRNTGVGYTVALLGALVMSCAVSVHGLPTVDDTLVVGPNGALELAERQNIPIPPALAKFPAGPLNMFLRMISQKPAGAKKLDALGMVLTPIQQGLANKAGVETTANSLEGRPACADMTLVFARGTTEPGNMGLVTGPPFVEALSAGAQMGGMTLAVQGVEYPATFAGFNKGGADGVPSMTKFLTEAMTACPNTKVVMSGYSQGALVLRATAESMPPAMMAKISSVVTFGDPGNPGPIAGAEGKTMIICHANDAVCQGGFITVDHLTYADDAASAAQFVMSMAAASKGNSTVAARYVHRRL